MDWPPKLQPLPYEENVTFLARKENVTRIGYDRFTRAENNNFDLSPDFDKLWFCIP